MPYRRLHLSFSLQSTLTTFSLLVLIASVAIIGCSNHGNEFASRPEVAAKPLVGESFGTTRIGFDNYLYVAKSALQKEFLLQGAMLEQETVAMGSAIKSRVVVFTRYGDKIFLLEATQGHVVTSELPSQLVLASFNIVAENDSELVFDFNEGMSNIFAAEEWAASDINGADHDAGMMSIKTKNSRIIELKVGEGNRVSIRQVVQLAVPMAFSPFELNSTMEIRYYLTPYQPDPNYRPIAGGRFNRVGFFETSPILLSNGLTRVLASRHSLEKPIVFAVSSNTPAEYRTAVKDGITYWNRAFGKEVIQVVDGPEGLTAPNPDFNIVQWVPFDAAGFAFADAQMDPRTGQILHAQVFLTSAFAFSGKVKARMLLNQLRSHAESRKKMARVHVGHFSENRMCDYDLQERLIETLSSFQATDVSDEKILKVSQDYVRAVTAHEIGHTLGLRHNFAGSLHTQNYPLEKRHDIFHEYLGTDTVGPEVVVSSSVMEYPEFEEDIIMGYQIRKAQSALAYDSKALEALYQGKKFKYGEIPLFCTDSDVNRFADCKRFDAGKSLVEYAAWATREKMHKLPAILLQEYLKAKSPFEGQEPTPVEEIGFSPDEVATSILGSRSTLISAFGDSSRLLDVFRSFPFVGDANLEEVKKKEREFLIAEIQRSQGMGHVFSIISSQYAKTLVEEFDKLVALPSVISGEGPGGTKYELSAEEIATMKAGVALLATKLPAALAKADLTILGRIPQDWKITNTELGDGLATALSQRVTEYIFTRTGEKLKVDIEVPVDEAEKAKEEVKAAALAQAAGAAEPVKEKRTLSVSLPKFLYTLETRKKAAELLSPGSHEDSIDWGIQERGQQKAQFLELLNEAIGCPQGNPCKFEKIKADDVKVVLPEGVPEAEAKRIQKDTTRWFIENKAVLSLFK